MATSLNLRTRFATAASALALATTLAPAAHAAADATFTTLAAFQGAAGSTLTEGFEAVAPRVRSIEQVVTPLMVVSTTAPTLGVQGGPESPEPGFGSFATEGSRYLLLYAPGQIPGEIRFDLGSPSTAFAFDLTDLETTGSTVVLYTDLGAYANGVTLETVAGNADSGSLRFFGITQAQPFGSVRLSFNGLDEALGIDQVRVSPVPEPAAAVLWAAGLAALGLRARRRRGGAAAA